MKTLIKGLLIVIGIAVISILSSRFGIDYQYRYNLKMQRDAKKLLNLELKSISDNDYQSLYKDFQSDCYLRYDKNITSFKEIYQRQVSFWRYKEDEKWRLVNRFLEIDTLQEDTHIIYTPEQMNKDARKFVEVNRLFSYQVEEKHKDDILQCILRYKAGDGFEECIEQVVEEMYEKREL
jgi:hypothetical protein